MASYRDKLPSAGGGGAVIKSVQRGSAGILAGQTSTVVTVSQVDVSKSFIKIYSSATQVGTEYMNSVLPLAEITNSTTLTFSRSTGSVASQNVTVFWELVEFASGVSIQSGIANTSNAVLDVTISTIDPSKSMVFFSMKSGSGSQNITSAHVCLITNSNNVRFVAPAAPSASVTFNWQVISYV